MKKVERQHIEWEKIFASHISDYSGIQNLQKTPTTQPKDKQPSFFQWAKNLNRHFSKIDIKMADKPMKRFSTLLVIGKM